MGGVLTKTSASGNISVNISGYYDRTLLDRLVPSLVHVGYGMEKPLPKKEGDQITFRRYGNLSVATTALTEGVSPAGSQLTKTDYAASPSQYGDYVTVTDWLETTVPDAILTEAAQILGDQAGDTLDQLCRDVIVAGTQVKYSNSTPRTAVNTILVAGDIQYAENLLERGKVKMIREKIMAGRNIATEAVEAGYIAIGHTDLKKTIQGFTNFINVKDYARGGGLPGEIGSLGNVRIILTPNGKIWAGGGASGGTNVRETSSSADVYALTVFGQGAYGNSRIGKKSVKNIVKGFGSAGTEDALDQRSTSGWKANFITKILDDTRIVRIECAAADLDV